MAQKHSLSTFQSPASRKDCTAVPAHNIPTNIDLSNPKGGNSFLAIDGQEPQNSDEEVSVSLSSSVAQLSSDSFKLNSADERSMKYSTDQIDDIMRRRTQLMEDLNIDKNITRDSILKPSEHTNLLDHKSPQLEKVSPIPLSRKSAHSTAYLRGALVKEIFSDYYDSLEKFQTEIHKDPNGDMLYPGIEGVFNPLQIMRDRRIRKSEGVSLRKGPFSKVKLPSQTFSRHKKPRLIWQINPYEYSGDLIWRRTHLNQLRKSNGKLWVSKKNRYIGSNPETKNELIDDGWNTFGFKSLKVQTDNENPDSAIDPNQSSASRARHEQYEIKNRAKRLVTKVASRSGINDQATSSPSRWYPGMLTSFNTSSKKRKSLLNNNNLNLRSSNSSRDNGNVSYASIPAHSRESLGAIGNSASIGSSGSTFKEEALLIKQIRYKLDSSNLHMHNSNVGFTQLLLENSGGFSKKLKKFETLQMESQDESRKLANQIELIDETIHSLSLFNGKQSTQLEELLGYCDRTNGEINTSITLKIRDLNERLDKLMTNDNDTLMNLFYNFVEMIIVFFLWVIWIVVEVLRFTKGTARIFLRILKWILF